MVVQHQLDSDLEVSSDEQASSLDPESEELSGEDCGVEDQESSDEDAGFFDLEAKESSDEGDSNSDDGSVSEPAFGLFMQLPPELRARVWEVFCPDLVARGRFLNFPDTHDNELDLFMTKLVLDPFLEQQTRSLRYVMAVHRESRRLASVAFPHFLQVQPYYNSYKMIPFHFNQHSDIIRFTEFLVDNDLVFDCEAPTITDTVSSFAVSQGQLRRGGRPEVMQYLTQFPKLKRLYVWTHLDSLRCDRELGWTVSDRVHQYMVKTEEIEPGLGEDTETIYCWPDVDRHPEFEMPAYFHGSIPDELVPWSRERGVEILPLFIFDDALSPHRYYDLLAKNYKPCCCHSSNPCIDGIHSPQENHDFTDSLGYESEGIDDSPFDDDSEDGDEEEIIHDSDTDEGQVVNDSEEESLGGSDDDGRLQAANEPSEARFSSPELEEQGSKAPGRRPPKRKIVIDSDEEEEEEEAEKEAEETEPRAKRLRLNRHIVADSDSDESVAGAAVEPDKQSSERGASITRGEHQPSAEEDDSSDDGDSSDGTDDSDSEHGLEDGDSVEDDDHQDDDEGDDADEDGVSNDMMSEDSEDF